MNKPRSVQKANSYQYQLSVIFSSSSVPWCASFRVWSTRRWSFLDSMWIKWNSGLARLKNRALGDSPRTS